MRVHLLNSAMLPKPGVFKMCKIPAIVFKELVNKYTNSGKLISYIGYETTAKHIQEITNVRISLNRDQLVSLNTGDIILVCKLKYRIVDSSNKSAKKFQDEIQNTDFEYYVIYVKEIYPDDYYIYDFDN